MAERKEGAEFVFFYGTLLPEYVPVGMRNVVNPLRFRGEGWVRGLLYDLGEYPGAVFDTASDRRIYGAVFQLPDDSQALEALDRYEGFEPASAVASLFVRRRQSVELSSGGTIECWAYEYNGNPQGARILESGRYRKATV